MVSQVIIIVFASFPTPFLMIASNCLYFLNAPELTSSYNTQLNPQIFFLGRGITFCLPTDITQICSTQSNWKNSIAVTLRISYLIHSYWWRCIGLEDVWLLNFIFYQLRTAKILYKALLSYQKCGKSQMLLCIS